MCDGWEVVVRVFDHSAAVASMVGEAGVSRRVAKPRAGNGRSCGAGLQACVARRSITRGCGQSGGLARTAEAVRHNRVEGALGRHGWGADVVSSGAGRITGFGVTPDFTTNC